MAEDDDARVRKVGSIIELRKPEEAGHGDGDRSTARYSLPVQTCVGTPVVRRGPSLSTETKARLVSQAAAGGWSAGAGRANQALKHPCSCSLP